MQHTHSLYSTVLAQPYDFLYLDNKINEQLEKLDTIDEKLEDINKQLESLNEHDGQCCNMRIGSFHNPAHNCSHIAHEHTNISSGTTVLLYVCHNNCCHG